MLNIEHITLKKRRVGYWSKLKKRFNTRPKHVFVNVEWRFEADQNSNIFCGEEVLELFPHGS